MTLDHSKSKAAEFKIIWSSSPDCVNYKSYFSTPELIEFPTEVPGQTAYAYFYPPCNPIYKASQEEKPPLLLKSHGMLTDGVSVNLLFILLKTFISKVILRIEITLSQMFLK